MLMKGLRILFAIITASAVGLSCAACLAPTNLSQSSYVEPEKTYQVSLNSVSDNSLMRMPAGKPTVAKRSELVPTASVKTQQYQSAYASQNIPSQSGRVSGIDIAVAEFAQSTSSDKAVSPLRLNYNSNQYETNRIDAEYAFRANREMTGLGLDLSLRPHISVEQSGDIRSTRAGAQIRLGDNLDLRGKEAKNGSWYLFAGADGEAVVWDASRAGSALSSDQQFTLQDRVTIGDEQFGVGFQSPAGEMSVSYISREYEYRNGEVSRSGEEDFVALALTWRH